MAVSPASVLGGPLIGNDAGWALSFHLELAEKVVDVPVCTFGREQYYGEIQATLPSGLAGGTYTFVLEGITDEDYRKIAQSGREHPTVVRLYLFWRDTLDSPAGYLASVAGLTDLFGGLSAEGLKAAQVAELSILNVGRKAGTRRYEAEISAQERVFYKARSRKLQTLKELDTAVDQVKWLAGDLGVSLPPATPPQPPPAGSARVRTALQIGMSYRQALDAAAQVVEQATGKRGRGMLLIRNGALHFGPRAIPLEGEPKELSVANGLVEVERSGQQKRDPNEDVGTTPLPSKPRAEFTLTLKGRPDLKPGDVVSFHPAPEDAPSTLPTGALSAVAASFTAPLIVPDEGEPVLMYVNSVQHKLGRTSGFVTTVSGVEIANTGEDAWDKHSTAGSVSQPDSSGSQGGSADGAVEFAAAVRRIAEDVVSSLHSCEVGEVRASAQDKSDANRPPQTLRVWRGLAEADGAELQAARLPVRRDKPSAVDPVPYLTPFAWGNCGLVLPRYPGTRVLLAHRNGVASDAVDIGAVWDAQVGAPATAKPGDWWLILPVDFATEQERKSIDETATPGEHKDKVTQDLIDAEGNRVIEVGSLTIRIGKAKLKKAGERPTKITLENPKEQAQITIEEDGKVTIHAAKDLVLEAPEGAIKLEAKTVDVKVSDGAMDVHS